MTKTKESRNAEDIAGCGNEAKSLDRKLFVAQSIEYIDADSIQAAAEEALGRNH